jgi:hypothetical protein
VVARFPFDPQAAAGNPLPYNEQQLRARVAQYADFVARCPQLFPTNLTSPTLFAKLDREVGRFLAHESTIKRFLQSDPKLIALCHWNANIDNAWFWRDEAGVLQCGLLDWGHANQMNVAFALWGSCARLVWTSGTITCTCCWFTLRTNCTNAAVRASMWRS